MEIIALRCLAVSERKVRKASLDGPQVYQEEGYVVLGPHRENGGTTAEMDTLDTETARVHRSRAVTEVEAI